MIDLKELSMSDVEMMIWQYKHFISAGNSLSKEKGPSELLVIVFFLKNRQISLVCGVHMQKISW